MPIGTAGGPRRWSSGSNFTPQQPPRPPPGGARCPKYRPSISQNPSVPGGPRDEDGWTASERDGRTREPDE